MMNIYTSLPSNLTGMLTAVIFTIIFSTTVSASDNIKVATERLEQAESLRNMSEHRKAFEIFKELAGAYRADMSKEGKNICLEAMYGCIDDALCLSDYNSACHYLLLAEGVRESENIHDQRLEIYYSCMYAAMGAQANSENILLKGYPHAMKAFDYAVKTQDVQKMELSFSHLIRYLTWLDIKDGKKKLDSISKVYGEKNPDKLSSEIFSRYYKANNHLIYEKNYEAATAEYDSLLMLLPPSERNARKRATFLLYGAVPLWKSGKTERARCFLEEAIAIGDSTRQLEIKMIGYVSMKHLYEFNGDSALAKQFELKANMVRDSILAFAYADDIYSLEQIKDEKELQRQIAISRYRSKIMTWITIFAVTVMLIVFSFLLVLRCKNSSLQERARLLRQLLRENTAHKPLQDEVRAKYLKSNLKDDEKNRIAEAIRKVLDSEAVFETDFSLGTLAEEVGKSTKAVSQVINEMFNTNFSSVVNRIRIYEACSRLDAAEYSHLSLEGIAASVGYTQRNTFSTNFKKYTGMGIREYRKLSKDETRKLLNSKE